MTTRKKAKDRPEKRVSAPVRLATAGKAATNPAGTPAAKSSSVKRRVELLRSTSFFRDASAAMLRELAAGCVDLELAPGDVLCRAGEVGDCLYFVDSGVLEIYLDDAPLDTAGRGACLGEMSLVTDQPRSASIRALEPARILILDRKRFSQVLHSHPEIAWGIFHELSGKIRSSIDVRVRQHHTNKALKEAFERSVSRVVMEEILRRRNPAELLEGTTKQATVVFADVRAFTTLSESMPPKEVIDLLNEYLSAMVDVILDTGGTLDKFMGDGILAHFGVPLPGDNDPVSALRCAGQMHVRLKTLNKRSLRFRDTPLKIGVGLATGSVVAGCVGSERRMEYTVIGDVVNLASRLEGLTKLYGVEVLCCAETARRAADVIFMRRVDVVRVKGKSLAAELWTPAVPGLSPEMKKKFTTSYGDAFRLYEGGDFPAAAAAFDSLLAKYPHDGPTRTLRRRCREFTRDHPEKWDGVFMPKGK